MQSRRVRVYAQGPGIGDALWLTALAKNFKHQRPKDEFIPVTSHPEIFKYNPDIYTSLTFEEDNEIGDGEKVGLNFDVKTHAIDGYCKQLGLSPPFIRRNFIYLTEKEIEVASRKLHSSLRIIAVQSQAGPWTRNKDWIHERFEEVITYFRSGGYRCLQIGGDEDKRLGECVDFFGSVREVAALMSRCKLFIGPVSAGMHIASAVGIPAVIVFGGREDPNVITLENHFPIYTKMECSPCWRVEPCQNKTCMENIYSHTVIEMAELILSKQ